MSFYTPPQAPRLSQENHPASTCRVDSDSNDTFSSLSWTETPFYETNDVSPATDPMTLTGKTLCDIAERYPHLSLQVLEWFPHAEIVVTGKPLSVLTIWLKGYCQSTKNADTDNKGANLLVCAF